MPREYRRAYLVLVDPHRDGEGGRGEEGHERRQRSVDEGDGGDQKVIGVVDGEVELGRLGPLLDERQIQRLLASESESDRVESLPRGSPEEFGRTASF